MAETTVFTVRVTPELKDKLDVLAEAMDRPRSWVVNHALEGYVEAQMSFIEAVQEGIASAERGELIPHEEMMARVRERIAEAEARRASKATERSQV
ncbi:MAG: CopG family ribbon-helix-helix protein [Rhodospirillales bacterium]|nr:CopG family ribbon-helix-helix protein [Rhodospirillales bacterium]